MKYKNRKWIFKGIVIILILALIVLATISTAIANNVITSMSEVRVEKNDATLEDYGLVGEQINVVTIDDLKINGYVVPRENSKGNVLILHGMHGMDATSLFDYAKFIYDAGYTPIAIDMRAHGKSQGNTLSFGYKEVNDVKAIIKYLKQDKRFKDTPIILYGLSMGGSTAINTAAQSENVDGVIAVSPFLSIQSQVADYMKRDGAPVAFIKLFQPFINVVLWYKFNVNPISQSPMYTVKKIDKIPVFIIHGDKDTQTNVYQGKKLYESCKSDSSEIWIVQGKDHLIVENVLDNDSKEYREKVIEFLNKNFSLQ